MSRARGGCAGQPVGLAAACDLTNQPRADFPARPACELSDRACSRFQRPRPPGAGRSLPAVGGRERREQKDRPGLGVWVSRPSGLSLLSCGGGSQSLGKLLDSCLESSSVKHFHVIPTFRMPHPSLESSRDCLFPCTLPPAGSYHF